MSQHLRQYHFDPWQLLQKLTIGNSERDYAIEPKWLLVLLVLLVFVYLASRVEAAMFVRFSMGVR